MDPDMLAATVSGWRPPSVLTAPSPWGNIYSGEQGRGRGGKGSKGGKGRERKSKNLAYSCDRDNICLFSSPDNVCIRLYLRIAQYRNKFHFNNTYNCSLCCLYEFHRTIPISMFHRCKCPP